jgi:hypothetical protein
LRNGAADRSSAASSRPHQRLRALALALAAITALTPAAALAQPTDNVPKPANGHAQAVDRHHRPHATLGSITFTNPLGRSRGPGAGGGLP